MRVFCNFCGHIAPVTDGIFLICFPQILPHLVSTLIFNQHPLLLPHSQSSVRHTYQIKTHMASSNILAKVYVTIQTSKDVRQSQCFELICVSISSGGWPVNHHSIKSSTLEQATGRASGKWSMIINNTYPKTKGTWAERDAKPGRCYPSSSSAFSHCC